MPPVPVKKIKYKGKTVTYKTIVDLSKKLKIPRDTAKSLLKDIKDKNTIKYLINPDGEIAKFDITKKPPLILQEFGIKRLTNKSILQNQEIKSIKFTSSLPTNTNINVNLVIHFSFTYDGSTDNRKITLNYTGNSENLNDAYFRNTVQTNFMDTAGLNFPFAIIKVDILSQLSQQTFKIQDMILRESTPYGIKNLYNEVIENEKWNHCIHDYLKKKYKYSTTKTLKHLNTTNDIYEWCVSKNIKMIAYDIRGEIIESYFPTTKNKSKLPNLIFIAHNNHLYPLKNKTLNKVTIPKDYTTRIVKNAESELHNYIEKTSQIPHKVGLVKDTIKHFGYFEEDEYVLMVQNDEYDKCKAILESFGIGDLMTPHTTLKNISKQIYKLYERDNIDSFFPDKTFYKSGFNYISNEELSEDDKSNLTTIDKNKCYSHSLKQLNYVLKIDIKHHKEVENLNINEINDTYLYLVKPEFSSILLPDQNLYEGQHLKYCIEKNLKFEILQGVETTKYYNPYKKMILDLYEKLKPEDAKQIINIMIGKFEISSQTTTHPVIKNIVNATEKTTNTGHYKHFMDDLYFEIENEISINLTNKKPISIQIKDNARRILYEKMEELNLNQEDIVQIKTDSITFKNTNTTRKIKPKNIGKGLNDWKYEDYKPFNCENPFLKNNILNFDGGFYKNTCGLCYAGTGKSYKIMNEIIPVIEKQKIKDYIVLTPSYDCLIDYRQKKINCNVIQGYHLKNIIPKESILIVDEIGMVDYNGYNLLVKCALLGKQIIGYGDLNQLEPVQGDLINSPLFYNYMWSNTDVLNINRRNNFKISYYDELINTKDKKWLLQQVKKYNNKNWYDADLIVAYKNETRKHYNDLMRRRLNINDKTDIGAKLIATNNTLRKHNIFNKRVLKVKSKQGKSIILTDEDENSKLNYELDIDDINGNFDYAYCRTLYSIQGKTINSFYYCMEDAKFLENKAVYTLISRLRN